MKNAYGQYFTPKIMADFMVQLSTVSKTGHILEPSCGEGVFLDSLIENGFKNITAYEIDKSLSTDNQYSVTYQSFISANIQNKFDLIIGNPPYIRWKNLEINLKDELLINELWQKYCNSLCDYLYIFIIKSILLLNENGELIFICPAYWLNTSNAQKMRNFMLENGYINSIIHFNESKIFHKVTSSTIVFKYTKSKKHPPNVHITRLNTPQKITLELLENIFYKKNIKNIDYFQIEPFEKNKIWSLQTNSIKKKLSEFELSCLKLNQQELLEQNCQLITLKDVCDIGNGMVSGLDKAFQYPSLSLSCLEKNSLIRVIKAKDLEPFIARNETPYIFVNKNISEQEFQNNYPNFYDHLQDYKGDLDKRYQYNKNITYWQWVFLRNYKLFSQKQKRIFVPCKERISHKDYVRFALVDECFYPTQDVTAIFRKDHIRESIEYITAYLNQPIVFQWLKYNGVIKGNILEFSEKPLSSIPFKLIDWENIKEVRLHNEISKLTRDLILTKNISLSHSIQSKFKELLKA
ncbi:adenine-specific DNA-methyltransferase [Nicoletella semolina]|uniref:site-specific DNA-methyltransferase (adenine-specific) n=1 Tax=Nicoletella semolina TaxID=271160 RepID=A0A4R2N5H7_9PAST|nr:N-6 DNA methylase [Nicoletella semolina]MDH2925431.1 restriction endonuclease [Nicoletella semolina]TCP16120.1 adenine-specific DNA-methyltransferase [Nicoletella semolina]